MKYIDSNEEVAIQPQTLDEWRTQRRGRSGAVVVPNDVDIEALADELPLLDLIALQFPKWTDGRAYSQARLLRTRYRFGGEIRATGDVVADMLPLLARTGFDAVALRTDQSVETARRALGFFAHHYQGDVMRSQPRFAREVA